MARSLPRAWWKRQHWRGRTTLVAAIALLALSAVYLAARAAEPGTDAARIPDITAPPQGIEHAAEVHHFHDVTTMTATSDLVIRARVTAVKLGEPEFDANDPSGKPVAWARMITLEIDQVLFSKVADVPASVDVYEGHWTPDGDGFVGIEQDGVPWSRAGDSGYFFLKNFLNNSTKAGTARAYHLVSSQGRALVRAAGLDASAGEHSPLAGVTGTLSAGHLEAAVRQAGSDYTAGRVQPQPAGGSAHR